MALPEWGHSVHVEVDGLAPDRWFWYRFRVAGDVSDAIIGAAAGYGALRAFSELYGRLRNVDAMGHGDFKLFAALGAWFGWQALVPIILMASVIGAAVGIAMKVSSSLREGGYVPFGPFLAGAGLALALLHAAQLFDLVVSRLLLALALVGTHGGGPYLPPPLPVCIATRGTPARGRTARAPAAARRRRQRGRDRTHPDARAPHRRGRRAQAALRP